MIRCAFALVLCGAVLSACTGIPSMPSFNMPGFTMPSFSAAGTPVRIESNPPGAEASFGSSGPTCKTPCTLPAPPGAGTYNVTLTLKGYEQQMVPVHVQIGRNSWESGDAGLSTTTVIEPDPVVAELSPIPVAAPPARKRPVAPVKPKTPPKQPTAAAAPPTPATSTAPAPPTFSAPPAATQPNVFR